jgi:hypothetical protein
LGCLVKNALLCLEATTTTAATILWGIQGDASFTAAVFPLLADIAASAAVVSVEDYVGAYAVAAEVLR